MKIVSAATANAWTSGDFTGANRPMCRATIQKMFIKLVNYDLAKVPLSTRKGTGKFATAPFGQKAVPVELPNVKSIRWSRSLDQDVATATIVLYNTAPVPLGQVPDDYQFDVPGYYTANRGDVGNRWGDSANGWRDLIVPDRVVRTYEGYGYDPELPPETDPHMYPSGVWLIDRVSYSPTAPTITLECRDLGRLLVDHIMFPPVVPWNQYPLTWTQKHTETRTRSTLTTSWYRPRYQTDSNIPYVGRGITDGGAPYVSGDGSVYGHHGRDAFDTSNSTYWLSVGNRPNWSSAYEYVQGAVTGTLRAVNVRVWGGPYRMYISVMSGGKWRGSRKIPYRSRVVDTNADIPYVVVRQIDKDEDLTVKLPAIANAQAIRITFSHLYNSGLGYRYRYRAGVRSVSYSATTPGTTSYTVTVGDYTDYTDIVKFLLAWGGFYWPAAATKLNFITRSDGTRVTVTPPSRDPLFPAGRVWGDLEQAGLAGVTKLDVDVWDKKPLMDGIAYIRDILGYHFAVGEEGGALWRSPNVFALGNYIYAPTTGSNGGRTSQIPVIDERQTLLDLTPTLSSAAMREKIFVGNIAGRYAATSAGFIPTTWRAGMRRVGGWTDQRFASTSECQIMADLITLRQSFELRTNSLTITANPALQVDDQVLIYERITGEHYYHRIRAITSEWDLETGRWTYQLETHWLGETPFTRWAFNPAELAEDTRAYLQAMGRYTP